jgi:hypothetical protein
MRTIFLVLSILSIPCICAGADQESIGRLFSTPAERAKLDQMRERGQASRDDSAQSPTALPIEPPRTIFSLDGYVRRSNGKSTTWINQVAQTEVDNTKGIRVQQSLSHSPTVFIALPSGKQTRLKVGQTIDASTGAIRDVYGQQHATSATKP